MYGVGKQVILRLTQSSQAGARTELGNKDFEVIFDFQSRDFGEGGG